MWLTVLLSCMSSKDGVRRRQGPASAWRGVLKEGRLGAENSETQVKL